MWTRELRCGNSLTIVPRCGTVIYSTLGDTMNIKYLSDLHLEFENETISDYFDIADGADVVVIAGDLSISTDVHILLETLSDAIYPIPLIYVTGNHDYYRSSKKIVNDRITKSAQKCENLHFLNRSCVVIDGVKFIGVTGWQMWPDYYQAKYYMINDFNHIKHHDYNVSNYAEYDYNFIVDALENTPASLKTVVITHILPSYKAFNQQTSEFANKGPRTIKAYYNEFDNILIKYKPDVWICGHSHDSIQEIIEDTYVVRNALGYKNTDRENLEFSKYDMVII